MNADRLARCMALLREAEAPVRVLRHLAWPASVRADFFAGGARRLPRVEYPPFDPDPGLAPIATLRRELGRADEPVAAWILRQADAVETAARMLAATGTPAFLDHARRLYGAPRDPLPDQNATVLDLAQRFDEVIDSLDNVDLGPVPPAERTAAEVADAMQRAVARAFGDSAPGVVLVDELSANALAGPRNIRIRRGAAFTDTDIAQLIHHEAHIHVATSLNGLAQTDLPILGSSHAGTTRTQEGLAVFAEFITGSMDLDRTRRLADRVIAIDMAAEGADFLEVYHWFLARTADSGQAFESTRRVFRGGPLTGGAPFTKDGVYLDGLLRVHHFMRTAVSLGRADLLRLMFCGKLDIEDLPTLAHLASDGLCRPPRFLPPWAEDLRFLVSYLAYSSFLTRMDLDRLHEHYAAIAHEAPVVECAGGTDATAMAGRRDDAGG